MKANRTIRFTPEMNTQLQELANDSDISVAAVVRHAVEAYLEKRDLAAELKQIEARVDAGMQRTQKEAAKVGDDLQLLIAIVDQLARFQFATTPEVFDRAAALATGNRRHEAFIQELHNVYSARDKRSQLAQSLESLI
jgi:predicted transcriptional regulator